MYANRALMTLSLFGAILLCFGITWTNASNTVGTAVADHVAAELRGGGKCNNSYTYNRDNPLLCVGGQCAGVQPNSLCVGCGTAGSGDQSCGADAGCEHYTCDCDCASG
jgi:hypothetical protein